MQVIRIAVVALAALVLFDAAAQASSAAAAYQRAAAKPHPRSMPHRDEILSPELIGRVERRMNGVLMGETQAAEESRRAIAALRAYAATRDARHYEEALRRARHIAAWDPRGATSHGNAPEDSRTIAWTLALAYDWLAPRLSAADKARLLEPLRVRAAELHRDHSIESTPTLTAISTLVAGDVPEARHWTHKPTTLITTQREQQ